MKRLGLIAGLALVAIGALLFSISRAEHAPNSSRAAAQQQQVEQPPSPTSRPVGSLPKPPSLGRATSLQLRAPLTLVEKQAADRFATFVSASRLSSVQEARLRQALWDARRNRINAKQESDCAFREALEEFASVEKNGKKYMTQEDSERMKRALAERGTPVDEQAFQAVDAEVTTQVGTFLDADQLMQFETTFLSPSSFALELPFEVR